jgi:hypothetical protein
MAVEIYTIHYNCLSSRGNDIAKNILEYGLGAIKRHKYAKLILPVILYMCEIWPLTLMEGQDTD